MKTAFRLVYDWLKNKPREWYRKRWIPLSHCESIWLHWKRATKASVALVIWAPDRIVDKEGFPLMWLWHDWTENDMRDYTPSCNITPEEKFKLEAESISRLRKHLWSRYEKIIKKSEEYLEWKTQDAKEMFYIDKALAWIGALEYERQWFNPMNDFHPYALEKLSWSNFHKNIYTTLLQKQFNHVDFFTQYFLLLKLSWNIDDFKQALNK